MIASYHKTPKKYFRRFRRFRRLALWCIRR